MAKIVSLNVKGLNANIKRCLLLTQLKASKADIAFIQETHFNKIGNFRFAQRLYPQAYIASTARKKISHLCPIQVIYSIVDPNGRYVILQTSYKGTPLILCNDYVAQIRFLSGLFSRLSRLPPSALLIGGDLNVAFSNVRDKLLLPGKHTSPSP